ncbi:ArsB/NhaD family transporter [Roseiarcaceae bacterium H3SJ34-1]|uniref:SLC13 family permease n=1 Tax=Terripilifer ovatus TaxID=3032367 RepID=UPI003AB990F4|nr:ArsB/NhaD family transporter [Roseiarcaceae bacterium H3SJ34-1]
MNAHAVSQPIFGLSPMWLSAVLLGAVYAALIWDKINRAIVALLGLSVVILSGLLSQDEAVKGIDTNTIGLLTGMMILVSISRRSGMFEYVAVVAAQLAKAHPAGILLLLSLATAILSALLDNVTTVLLIVPVTLHITRELEIPPYPFLFAEILASNIGGTATLIGDPPNILIGSLVGLSFNSFIVHLAPVIVIIMLVQAAITHLVWGRAMKASPGHRAKVMTMQPAETIKDMTLLKQALCVLTVVITAFIFARPLHLEPATIAIAGAAVLMFLDNWQHHTDTQAVNVHRTFSDIEWITIFFFAGLFVIVHSVEVGGLLNLLAQGLVAATGGNLPRTGFAVLWASAVLSAIVDNIPFVATMIPLIKSMAPAFGGPDKIEPLWWCLSLGACLGGNGTLIGASANLTVAGIAERNGIGFSFWTYTKFAFPMMLVSVAIAHLYVWWRYF